MQLNKKKEVLRLAFIFVIVTVLGISFQATTDKDKSCEKGSFSYAPADYQSELFIKKKYQQLFDSILTDPLYDCFCKQDIKDLPTRLPRNEQSVKINKDSIQQDISIEPFFIDLKTFDGLYGMRKWKRKGKTPKYLCGFWHHLFVISNNKYIPLTNDSTMNVEIVKSKLSSTFTNIELTRIINWNIGHEVICSNYTFMWPELIKEADIVVWDLEKESRK